MFCTVIVTAYNRGSYVYGALKSIINQRMVEDSYEIILISNLTNMDLRTFCKSHNIKFIHSDGKMGEYLFFGIQESKGDVIAFLDDDDEWVKDKLSKIVNIFKRFPDVSYIHNNFSYIDESGQQIHYRRMTEKFNSRKEDLNVLVDEKTIKKKIKQIFSMNADFNLSCISIRKSFLKEELLNILKRIESAPDAFFFFSALLSGSSLFILSDALTMYRIHRENVSSSTNFHSKSNEVHRELKTLLLLEANLHKPGRNSPSINSLKMMMIEYSLLETIWSNLHTRGELIRYIIKLLNLPYFVSNPLRWRLIVLSLIGVIDPRIPFRLYKMIAKKSI